MRGEKNRIFLAPEAIFALVFLSLSGMEFLAAPYGATRYLGPGAYWAVPIGVILSLPSVFLIRAWHRRFPGEDLPRLAVQSFGRFPAVVGNLLFLSVYLLWTMAALRDAGDLVLAYLLDRTPLWVVIAFILLGSIYVAANGLVNLFRLAEFVLLPALIFRLGMSLVSWQGMKVSHLFPVFSAPWPAYLKGGLEIWGTFLPLTALFFLVPHLPKTGPALRSILAATGMATGILFLDAVGAIGVFGAEMAQELAWPSLAGVHHVSFPYLLVEQLGLIFLIVWLVSFFLAVSFYLYLVTEGVTGLFPALSRPPVVLSLALIVALGSLLLPNIAVLKRVFEVLRRFAMLPAIGYPGLVYLVAVLRQKGGRNHG